MASRGSERLALLAALLAMIVAVVTREARAEIPATARANAERMFREAEEADEAYDFARALARYDEARTLDPGSARAPRAEARAAILRAHAEGAFGPFAKLERVRRDPSLASDAGAIDALVADAEAFPPGPTQVEVWVLAAEAYLHRLGRPAVGESLLRRIIEHPKADPVLAQKAARDLVVLQVARGDLAGAETTVQVAGARADAKLASDVARLVRRRHLHRASIALLAIVLGLAAWTVTAALRGGAPDGDRTTVIAALRRTTRFALIYAAYVAVSGALLATSYEQGTAKPFLVLGVVIAPLVLVARAWGAAGRAAAWARAARAIACGASVVAAGFLVLEGVDATFLESMGL